MSSSNKSTKSTKNQHLAAKFWQIFRGYWRSEERARALGLLAVVVVMNFATVYLLVLINSWYNEFYNALQGYDYASFWPLVGKFTVLALLHIVIAVYAIYLQQLLQLRWRTWLTRRYTRAWLTDDAYYRLQVMGSDMDNPDQRIQEDISQFVTLTLSLLIGFLKQLTTLAAFAVVLWQLSGVLTVPLGSHELSIYGYMLWFSLIYSVVGTGLAHLVGRKLIGLNYDQQRYEADFRFSMTRVRENSESIAFYGGELAEEMGFRDRFKWVIDNYRGLMRQTKLLNFYANFYGQFAIIAPLILAAPRYFSGAMTLGGLMQTVSAFGRVQDALSYFVNAYDNVAQLAAVLRRLSGFTEHLEDVRGLEPAVSRENGEPSQLIFKNIFVQLPNGKLLLSPTSFVLPAGKRLLVTGASGCGKSTLLRTLAGIWPFGGGELEAANDAKIMFLPQRPYLPLGTLRRALCYPLADTSAVDDKTLIALLHDVDLDGLAGRLDTTDDWSRILSLGEQQRIAFARVLIARPDWIFLDEATSALDERREMSLYFLLKTKLPNAGVISVGHRSSLFNQHDKEMHIEDTRAVMRDI